MSFPFSLLFFFNSTLHFYAVCTSRTRHLSLFLLQLIFPPCIFCHFLFLSCTVILSSRLSSFFRANRLLRHSAPTPSLVPFSHSLHSHASPSTIFILFRASFFPFSRFSPHLFCSISCLLLRALSLFVFSSRAPWLNLYVHPPLRYRVDPSLFRAVLFSFHFGRQRQNKSLPTEGINENRLVEAIIGRTRVQEARGGVANWHRGGG